jgi:hypothetical protein
MLSKMSYDYYSYDCYQDVSELRRQLDESLEAVAANSGLEAAPPPGLLDREADRLQETLGRYTSGADYSRINRSVFVPKIKFMDFRQCCESMTSWCGSGSGSTDPCL